ncbi:MAG: acetyl-CoA carboxylase biotin carboxyl carrier protein [Planctomycetales bacterium]|nr:acetyl-CoA carboxylase biotin carboxyl carrier protein [Planctomycetales bacterium]
MSDKTHIDLKKVKELIDLMKENELVELEIADGDSKVHLKRPGADMPIMHAAPMHPLMPAASAASPAAPSPAEDASLIKITSPIVGTFYQAPSPDSEPFVRVGGKVHADTVVCIIEAMKVMNEIKAETGGTIVEVCCKDGEAVEYGQVLFKVRP